MSSIFLLLTFVPFVFGSYSEEWDLFIFSQEWPPAVCIQGKEEHHKCVIEPQVVGWGIHGLWPTKFGTEGPTSCNNSWHFDPKKIESLRPAMEKYWPNMYSDTSPTSFWEHEWTKHGTCAASLPATGNEFKYFSTALNISHVYDATRMFNKHGIIPDRSTSYNYTDFMLAIEQEIGTKPVIQCTYDKETRKHVIYEIEICLNKTTFKAVSCYRSENSSGKRSEELIKIFKKSHHHHSGGPQSDCPTKSPIYYFPIPGLDSSIIGRDVGISVL